tara:strand:- start:116 stop:283 length:168 start_codon:yes stop_codon:yes gene_type:complete
MLHETWHWEVHPINLSISMTIWHWGEVLDKENLERFTGHPVKFHGPEDGIDIVYQ